MQDFKGKTILITGGNRGIGLALVKHFAGRGARVAFTCRSREEEAQKIMGELPGEGHLVIKMDVRDPHSVSAGFATLKESFGSLSYLVNNAGIIKDNLSLRMSDSDFDLVLKTNLYGTFYCSREALKIMLKRRQGAIVNMSSVVAKSGNPGQANYVASKAGIEGLTRTMAHEVASRNIRINAVAPGYIDTAMTKTLSEEHTRHILNMVASKRMGTMEEVAEAVAFLLQAEYITGHVLAVDGGML